MGPKVGLSIDNHRRSHQVPLISPHARTRSLEPHPYSEEDKRHEICYSLCNAAGTLSHHVLLMGALPGMCRKK